MTRRGRCADRQAVSLAAAIGVIRATSYAAHQAEESSDSGSAFRLRLSARETIRGARVMPIYTYATLDDPSSSTGATVPLGINDAGQIVGGSGNHGFAA